MIVMGGAVKVVVIVLVDTVVRIVLERACSVAVTVTLFVVVDGVAVMLGADEGNLDVQND